MENIIKDIKLTFRWMRKRPAFTVAILLSVALGVGANTAIFSMANMMMLRPLPFPEDHELYRINAYFSPPGKEPRRTSLSPFNINALKEQADVFEDVGGWHYISFNMVGTDEPIQVYGARATANSFSILGVSPILGRVYTPDEDLVNAPAKVVVISYALWQRHFGGGDDVIGKTVKLDNEVHEIIGVMPQLYEYPYKSKIWVPMGMDPTQNTNALLHSVGRARPGVSKEQIEEQLDVVAKRLESEFPDTNTDWGFGVMTMRDDITRDLHPKRAIFMLMGGAAFLLMIACVNIANLLLSRSLEQRRDVAIHSALGVPRWRMVQQLITQGLTLSLLGGVLGTVLAYFLIKPIVALNPSEDLNVIFMEIRIDYRVLGFAFLLSVLIGVIFSLIPALKISKPNLQSLLSEGAQAGTGRRGQMLKAMVVVEVATTVILLIGSGLMLKGLYAMQTMDAGFNTEDLLIIRITPSDVKYPERPQKIAYLDEVNRRLEALPSVETAGLTSLYPNRTGVYYAPALPEGRSLDEADGILLTNHRLVSPGYIEAMQIPLIAGRTIDSRDQEDNELVVVVSETFAKNAWPGQTALDKRVKIGARSRDYPWMRVVGVVGDVVDNGEFVNTWYLPFTQMDMRTPYLDIAIRTKGGTEAVIDDVRQAVWSIDEEQAIAEIATAKKLLTGEFWGPRSGTFLLSLFAIVGLALAIVGIFGIQSYSMQLQKHEMGVRMAFGAQPGDILRSALRQGILVSALGIALGIGGALFLTRFLQSLLFEVSPFDPYVFALIALVALVISFVAHYLPAYRATRFHLADALRYE